MNDNAREPAFGYSVPDNYNNYFHGLTKREYAKIHAPSDIPEWFKHIPAEKTHGEKPTAETWKFFKTDKEREEAIEWQRDPIYDLPTHLMGFQMAVEEWRDKDFEWRKQDNIFKYFQWREFFASNVL